MNDDSKIGEKTWKELKPLVMEADYQSKDFYKALSAAEKDVLEVFRLAQES